MPIKLKRKPMRRWTLASLGGGALVARLLRRLHDEGKCMMCDERIAEAEQVEQVTYARPCGHRIGSGDAAAYNRGLKGTA
jgi:hypothetical protein